MKTAERILNALKELRDEAWHDWEQAAANLEAAYKAWERAEMERIACKPDDRKLRTLAREAENNVRECRKMYDNREGALTAWKNAVNVAAARIGLAKASAAIGITEDEQ